MAKGGWDVFVSYGHEDAEWVRALAANLERAGLKVFFDEWELVGGDRITWQLEKGVHESASGVLVVSPHSLSRPWVREEYEALLRQAVEAPGRRLVPVLYADAELPVFLANRLWVDFRGAASAGPSMTPGSMSWCGTCRAALPPTGPPETARRSGRQAPAGSVSGPPGRCGRSLACRRRRCGWRPGMAGSPSARGAFGARRSRRPASLSGAGPILTRGPARVRAMPRCWM